MMVNPQMSSRHTYGMNHHYKSCIFCGAFCFDMTIKTFEWLFKIFIEAMNGKHLKVVCTDSDKAIADEVCLV
ncbi:hypothetical protein EJ110_NYTH16071 [Nymphaea thermarum]|nr:hypothetical protein EJ110_NYTH16071 [Nymphaea thermarum]